MFVSAMNAVEVYSEFLTDGAAVLNKTYFRIRDTYHKERRKGNVSPGNPYPKVYPIKSHKKNNWVFVLTKNPAIDRYKSDSHIVFAMVTYYYAKDGLRVLKWLNSQHLCLFTGHFFTRYRERMNLGPLGTTETIHAYFKANPFADYKAIPHNGGYLTVGVCPDGFLLGENKDSFVCNKTFISRDLLRPDQIDFEEKLIHNLQVEWIRKIGKRQEIYTQDCLGTDCIYLFSEKKVS